MFDPGDMLMITVIEGGSESILHNCRVLECEDGLLKIQQFDHEPVVYNMHSANFVSARKQS